MGYPRKPWLITLSLIVWTVTSLRLDACPACNIHNYLFSSLRSSSNVFAGVVTGPGGKHGVAITVTAVYRGTNTIGNPAKVETGYYDGKWVGQTYIFSDPKSEPPNFEMIPIELEWETKFLLRRPWADADRYPADGVLDGNRATIPDVRHKVDALRAVQGVSRVTRELGLTYIKSNRKECAALIESETLKLQTILATNGGPRGWTYSYAGIAEAYWLTNPKGASSNYLALIKNLEKRKDPVRNQTERHHESSHETIYLAAAIELSKEARSQKPLIEQLKSSLPKLEGQGLLQGLYVAATSGVLTPEETVQTARKLTQSAGAKRSAVATACFQIGWEFGSQWKNKQALLFFEEAKAQCEDAKLLEKIEERLQFIRRF